MNGDRYYISFYMRIPNMHGFIYYIQNHISSPCFYTLKP